jgi:prepilin-type processing-associated H-X9-DG protein
MAGAMYAHDYSGFFPPDIEVATGNGYSAEGSWVLGNAKYDQTDENTKKGVLWSYVRSLGTYHCPADRSTVRLRPDLLRFRSYQQNFCLNVHLLPPGTPGYPSILGTAFKESDVSNPAAIFSFIDVSQNTCDNAGCGFWYVNPPLWTNQPTDRHSKSGNIAFLDGHVESHRWLWSKTLSDDGVFNEPTVNDLDRLDLQWLLDRTTIWIWMKQNGFAP